MSLPNHGLLFGQRLAEYARDTVETVADFIYTTRRPQTASRIIEHHDDLIVQDEQRRAREAREHVRGEAPAV